ncbi:sulfotransferase [Persicimonas caeni]|uniref:Sulfotransferase n=1 Tax=Persicimonas caeni TaxID=2292766 RepID=A0A4Y6PTR4_PERCE|nr:sulfotransferase [Persicimonas caeni]QDG51712.1 sulfotransferase [Persicimonas caeni]QED32933.1 sulfotransferase [Persicimonas caeni]
MPKPIFILGITPRSGTAFLGRLLSQHPSCTSNHGIPEPYFVYGADHLVSFVELLSELWGRHASDEKRADLLRSLGDGLVQFLQRRCGAPDKRVIVKTPTVHNVELFFELFPDAQLVILVRDGRAVTESSVKSFQIRYEKAIRRWRRAADTILEFVEESDVNDNQWIVVRYEDLVGDLERECHRIFDFLDLDPQVYDFEAAQRSPVMGSSEARGGADQVHWKPVEKSADFDPLQRFAHWSPHRHRRFNWIAGKQLEAFGYERKQPETEEVWRLANRFLDLLWAPQNVAAKLYHRRRRLLQQAREVCSKGKPCFQRLRELLWEVSHVDALH